MALFDSTTPYYVSTWIYLVLLHSTMDLLHSTMAIIDSTWLYYILQRLYLTLLHSTVALLGSTWLYYTLYHVSTWLYMTLLHFTLALLDCNQLHYTLPCLYLSLHDSSTFYHGSTWLCLSLLHSTTALLHCTWLYYTLPWLYLVRALATRGRAPSTAGSQNFLGACSPRKFWEFSGRFWSYFKPYRRLEIRGAYETSLFWGYRRLYCAARFSRRLCIFSARSRSRTTVLSALIICRRACSWWGTASGC